jgi:hypothetical protein
MHNKTLMGLIAYFTFERTRVPGLIVPSKATYFLKSAKTIDLNTHLTSRSSPASAATDREHGLKP